MTQRVVARPVALIASASLTLVARGGSSGPDGAEPGAQTTATTVPAQPSTSAPPPPTTAADPALTIEVAFSSGQVRGGSRRQTVKVGDRVRIRSLSDVAEELHVHTYDQRLPLQPAQTNEVVFVANIAGRHEVEFEKSAKQALTLEVS